MIFKYKVFRCFVSVNELIFTLSALILQLFIIFGCSDIQTNKYSTNSSSLGDAALSIIDPSIIYDPDYKRIPYPNGDVEPGRGVCADVIVRAYRKMGIDLQERVHEDMVANFNQYPKKWGLNRPDPNIDHRRVPNLMTFFQRNGQSLSISRDGADYKPGDIVAWRINGGILHIGIVVHKNAPISGTPMVVHNIGGGQVMEDRLFSWQIIGHYRY